MKCFVSVLALAVAFVAFTAPAPVSANTETGQEAISDSLRSQLKIPLGKKNKEYESRILIQGSDGTYPDGVSIGASPLNKLIAGDVDGDRLMDVIAINDGGVHQLYRGKAGGSFELVAEQIVSDGVRRGLLVDVTNDESIDLILAGICQQRYG